MSLPRTDVWRRLDVKGTCLVRLDEAEDGFVADGFEVTAHTAVRFQTLVDRDWRTREVRVEATGDEPEEGGRARGGREGHPPATRVLLADGAGSWTVDGERADELEGGIDVDIAATPFTNTFPIRRLDLAVGEQAEIDAVWIGIPDLDIEVVPQIYRRLSPRGGLDRYEYRAGGSETGSLLTVDEDGVVHDYEDFAERLTGQRGYRRSVTVDAPIDRVWDAFTEPGELRVWHGTAEAFEVRPGGDVVFSDPGHPDVRGVVEEVEPGRYLRWRLHDHGSVVTEIFAADGDRTRITIRHEPDGPPWPPEEAQGIALGWDEAIADLVVLLEHDVRRPRHMTSRSSIGATTEDTPAGVRIASVGAGTFADEVGLRPGDLILELGGAPIFRRSDLALSTRLHPPGTEVAAAFVRDGTVITGQARLSAMG